MFRFVNEIIINFFIIIKNIKYFHLYIFSLIKGKKIVPVINPAIGHYLLNIYLWNKSFDKCIFFFANDTEKTNEFLTQKLQRTLHFDTKYAKVFEIYKAINIFKIKFIKIYNILLFQNKTTLITNAVLINRPEVGHDVCKLDYSSIFNGKKKIFEFNNNENAIGNNYLIKNNIHNKKFICLSFRTQEYYNETKDDSVSKMSFRNVDPSNYVKSLEYLTGLGYYIIRMGKNIKKPFPFKNDKFIDYAVSDERNDFLDIWLTAKCFFIYGPGGGLLDMSTAFNKPHLATEEFPPGRLPSFQPKSSFLLNLSEKNEKPLSIKDLIKLDVIWRNDGTYFYNNSIKILNNNPDDILNSLIDFIEKMEKGFELSKLSKIFWEKMSIEISKNPFNKDNKNKDRRKFEYFHDKNCINANIPDFYLKKYKKLFIEY